MQVILFTDVGDTPGYGKYAGAYKIASEIRANGYSCQVIDNYTWMGLDRIKPLVDKFVDDDTVLVGFSCTINEKRVGSKVLHWGIPDSDFHQLIMYIKSKSSNIKTLIGGSRIQYRSQWDFIDYSILNKGDKAVVALLDHLVKGSDLEYEQGKNHTKVVDGNRYEYSQEEFSRSMIKYEPSDIILEREALPIELARGCIFKCAYCHYDLIGKKAGEWTKRPEVIRDEMLRNHSLYGTTHYMISDELINESLDKLSMFHSVVSSLPFSITYTAYARADLIHRYPQMIDLLLDSGAVAIQFGIETFNPVAGKSVGKGLDPHKVKGVLERCKSVWGNRVLTSSNFIVGLPGESEEDIWKTVEYLGSESSPLDIVQFLPLFIRTSGDDRRNASRIDQDPKRFGYIMNTETQWANAAMTYEQAWDLVKRVVADPRIRVRHSRSAWIGRLISLGFTVEEIHSMLRDKMDFQNLHLDLIQQRTHAVKALYYQRLLDL